jgi:hypothetical protein
MKIPEFTAPRRVAGFYRGRVAEGKESTWPT